MKPYEKPIFEQFLDLCILYFLINERHNVEY